jgi:integrative and conjugative element protein (TIGR02256 family)
MIHWFKKHPRYLEREIKGLTNDPNHYYAHRFTSRGNLLVSHGNIIVRLDTIHRFPFLIVYSNATPYALPFFFPLDRELTKEEVEHLSSLQENQIDGALRGLIKYYPKLRHQNSSGVLCVLEWDNLDDGTKFYGISTLLKRVKDWCKGVITGQFPPESQEVEFTAHFNKVDQYLHFFYRDIFLDPQLHQGEAYANLYSIVPKGVYFKKEHRNYMGAFITGTNKNNVYKATELEFPAVFKDAGITNDLALTEKKGVVQKLITEGTLIKMYWFQVDEEPSPFETFDELVTIIGNGVKEAGHKRMASLCQDEMKAKPEDFFIALRFPNRKGKQEFQLLRVHKTDNKTPVLFNVTPEETFAALVPDYGKVCAVPSVLFSDSDFHQRNAGRADREILKSSIINMVGVGALGSEMADTLAKAGPGAIFLYDNQVMKFQNSVRHIAGIDYVGVLKVEAVKNEISLHNPFVMVHALPVNVNSVDINDIIFEDTISVSTIADDNTEAFLNERCVIANKTVYYVRALRGGKAARIFRVTPGKDACFQCLQLYREEKTVFIPVAEDEMLPTLKNECNNPIRPASAADLKLISSLASRFILDELQSGEKDTNHWIWSTEELGELKPFTLTQQVIPPHPKCCYCHHDRKATISIGKETLEFMKKLVAEKPGIETGGVLAGFMDNGNFKITHASEPGPKAICRPDKFEKDVEYCQSWLDELTKTTAGKTVYIGEWHSHPNRNNKPSNTDIISLTDISYQKEYLTDQPIMIIFSKEGEPRCTVHPIGKLFYETSLLD